MNEAENRAEHIDPALKASGWGVVEGSRIRPEFPITPGRIEGPGETWPGRLTEPRPMRPTHGPAGSNHSPPLQFWGDVNVNRES